MWPRQDQDATTFAGRYPGDETQCHFVSTFGLLKSCATGTRPRPGKRASRPLGIVAAHRPGGWIYVHPERLAAFARWVLPRIRVPFTLLSGNHTTEIRPGPVPQWAFDRILSHPHLVRWWAQNRGAAHRKLSALPLGLDYHTMSIGRVAFWGARADPVAQEAALDRIRRAAPPLADRDVTAFCNWHFAPDNPFRAAARARILPQVTVFQDRPTTRADTWSANARHLFTISPRGRGMDCHRTWEAILLGAVPIVEDLPIRDLWRDLPVIRIDDWAQVTPDFLAAARDRVLAGTYDFAPVLLEYWRVRIAGGAVPKLRMTCQEFIQTPVADLADAIRPQQY